MSTIRQQMMSLLDAKECDARMLSQILGLSEKEVYEHIPHIRRSASATGKTLTITAARCLNCGYEFRTRKKITKPGRCPKCRKERIDPPRFKID